MNNSEKIILFLLFLGGLAFMFYIFNIRVCPFFFLFKIPCPGCGLTRSIVAFFHFNFLDSLRYNILGIPLISFCFIYFLSFLFKFNSYIDNFVFKYRVILIILASILVIVLEIINIYNPLLY